MPCKVMRSSLDPRLRGGKLQAVKRRMRCPLVLVTAALLLLSACEASSGERYRLSVFRAGQTLRICGASGIGTDNAVNSATIWVRSTTSCAGYPPNPPAGTTGLMVTGYRNGVLCGHSGWEYLNVPAVSWSKSRRMCPLHSGSNYRTTAHFHAWSDTSNSYQYSALSSPTITLD